MQAIINILQAGVASGTVLAVRHDWASYLPSVPV